MDRLAGVEEILDGPLDDLDAVAGNLRDLATGQSAARRDAAEPAGDRPAVAGWRVALGARRRDRRGRHPGLAARRRGPARTVAPGRRRSTAEPRSSRRRGSRGPPWTAVAGLEPARRRRAGAPLPRRRVRRRPLPRWSSTTSSPPTRSRSCGSWRGSPGAASSSTTSSAAGSFWLGRLAHEPRRDAEPAAPGHDGPLSVRRAYSRPSCAASSTRRASDRRRGRRVRRPPGRDRRAVTRRADRRWSDARSSSSAAGRPARRPRPRARAARAATSSCSSGRPPGAGGPAACSPRRPRSTRCAGSASTRRTIARVARPIPAMRVETAAGTRSG